MLKRLAELDVRRAAATGQEALAEEALRILYQRKKPSARKPAPTGSATPSPSRRTRPGHTHRTSRHTLPGPGPSTREGRPGRTRQIITSFRLPPAGVAAPGRRQEPLSSQGRASAS